MVDNQTTIRSRPRRLLVPTKTKDNAKHEYVKCLVIIYHVNIYIIILQENWKNESRKGETTTNQLPYV